MATKKLLFFLPADKEWARVLRRGVAIFIAAGLAGAFKDALDNSGSYIPSIWLPLITAILAMIDKWARNLTVKKE